METKVNKGQEMVKEISDLLIRLYPSNIWTFVERKEAEVEIRLYANSKYPDLGFLSGNQYIIYLIYNILVRRNCKRFWCY